MQPVLGLSMGVLLGVVVGLSMGAVVGLSMGVVVCAGLSMGAKMGVKMGVCLDVWSHSQSQFSAIWRFSDFQLFNLHESLLNNHRSSDNVSCIKMQQRTRTVVVV